jgi:hypothetical protein
MRLTSLLPCIGCALLLAGCATDGPAVQKTPQLTLERVMAEADAASKAGQYDKALLILKGAASSYPADKTPWLQMAQMKFDRSNYGDAISNALEALQRDPEDTVANSIVVVSGLRLSTKALADLTRQNNLNGSVRSEAQVLAKLLRTSLGEEVLVPPNGTKRTPAGAKPPPRTTQNPPGKSSGRSAAPQPTETSTDPFVGLK